MDAELRSVGAKRLLEVYIAQRWRPRLFPRLSSVTRLAARGESAKIPERQAKPPVPPNCISSLRRWWAGLSGSRGCGQRREPAAELTVDCPFRFKPLMRAGIASTAIHRPFIFIEARVPAQDGLHSCVLLVARP